MYALSFFVRYAQVVLKIENVNVEHSSKCVNSSTVESFELII